MPRWLRISTVALLAGLCAGCGSGGLFWVDDKLSKFSAPSSKSAAPAPILARNDVAAAKPATDPTPIEAPTTKPHEDMDEAGGAPPKLASKATPRITELKPRPLDPEPIPQKPLPINEERIPAAFALATPRAVRGDRNLALEASPKRPAENELNPSDDEGGATNNSVTLASLQREEPSSATETSSAARRDDASSSERNRFEKTVAGSGTSEPTERSKLSSAPAKPIPKASPSPSANRLQVGNIALCTEILGFGKLAGTMEALAPGGKALVYVEVSGRSAKQTEAGVETRFNGKLRLTPKDGGATTEWSYPNFADAAPTEPNCFCFMTLQLPDSLSEGDYRLEVVVEDVHGGGAASEETSLRVERSTASTK